MSLSLSLCLMFYVPLSPLSLASFLFFFASLYHSSSLTLSLSLSLIIALTPFFSISGFFPLSHSLGLSLTLPHTRTHSHSIFIGSPFSFTSFYKFGSLSAWVQFLSQASTSIRFFCFISFKEMRGNKIPNSFHKFGFCWRCGCFFSTWKRKIMQFIMSGSIYLLPPMPEEKSHLVLSWNRTQVLLLLKWPLNHLTMPPRALVSMLSSVYYITGTHKHCIGR